MFAEALLASMSGSRDGRSFGAAHVARDAVDEAEKSPRAAASKPSKTPVPGGAKSVPSSKPSKSPRPARHEGPQESALAIAASSPCRSRFGRSNCYF